MLDKNKVKVSTVVECVIEFIIGNASWLPCRFTF